MAKPTKRKSPSPKLKDRTFDARPDTLDFRDRMFEPTLIEVPTKKPLEKYMEASVPILDQGSEGACTGFGLATLLHYLLRTRKVVRDTDEVSPRMLYEMARRYDEWPGEDYSGSSARGAMKGWHKHGVCSKSHWIYDEGVELQDSELFAQRFADAIRRPLGAYLRVNHKDIIAMHSAISEVEVLYATAQVHSGWGEVEANGQIAWDEEKKIEGGHAFAIVAYDEHGFWIQNSWGSDWGRKGFAQITYDDWLANGSDVWVARLGAPIELRMRESISRGVGVAAQGTRSYVFCDLRPHIISLGNDGRLRTDGTYGTSEKDVIEIFGYASKRMSQPKGPTRILLYAHGGLVAEDSAIQKVSDLRGSLLAAGVYPICLIWKTDFWTTLTNILEDSIKRRRPEGILDSAKDFMLDRLDDLLEPVARLFGGKSQWDEMKENAALASESGGLLVVLDQLKNLKRDHPTLEIHLVGHSAGAILLGGLVKAMAGINLKITSCTLWAPACTIDFYQESFLPAIRAKSIENFAVFALTDTAERDDDCAKIYHKSLLYLVSHAFERYLRQPWLGPRPGKAKGFSGEPLLGMAKWIESDLNPNQRNWNLILSPNTEPEGSAKAARSTSHGGFDDDPATLKATLARVLDRPETQASFGKGRLRSVSSNRVKRERLMIRK